MNLVAEWCRRLWYLLNRRRYEAALRRDIEAHRDAMQDARRFGNVLRWREASAEVWGWRWLDDAAHDVRFALRTLRGAPAFTLVVVATLALATGATAAIFSIVNGVLIRPLPFAEPDRLGQVYGRAWREERGAAAPDPLDGPLATPELQAYVAESRSFAAFAAYQPGAVHLDDASGRERRSAATVDLDLFTLLGAEALVGRPFRAGDPLDVVVISERLWRERFNADRSLIGRTILVNERAMTVLGVMPDAFQFPYRASSVLAAALPEARSELWLPMPTLRMAGTGELRRGRVHVVGRLARGVSMGTAQSELAVIAARVEARLRTEPRGARIRVGVRLEPLADVVVGPVRRSLWMLLAAVGLVLAAACANVANLLLARMTVRTREVVTRAALGASRLRLVRQFLAESLILAIAGGVAGALLARWGTSVLVALAAAQIPRADEIALDWQAFAFLLVVCLAAAVLFGLAPAWTAARIDVRSMTGDAGGRATMGRGYGRLRDGLVVLEVALAFVLASGAALVVRQVMRLEATPVGMQTDNVLTLHLTPRTSAADYEAIAARVAVLPGVRGAALTQLVPLQNWGWDADFEVRGRPSAERMTTGLRYVTVGYFRTLGIPVVKGRDFTVGDSPQAPMAVIVNEALVRRYFRGQNPVGLELNRGTIVGVVGDVRQAGLDKPVEPELYNAVAQNMATTSELGMSLLVRTVASPEPMTESIRAAVRGINPNLAIFNVRTMAQVRADSLWELHLYRWLIGLFALLAVVLATIGLYGVMSYHATSRLREFAVRLALGAAPTQVTRLVFGRGLRLAGLGLVAGLGVALLIAPVLRHVSASLSTDPITYVIVASLLLAVTLVACAIPAVRASVVNPVSALRHD
jgi:putative ABC transport system permease protein